MTARWVDIGTLGWSFKSTGSRRVSPGRGDGAGGGPSRYGPAVVSRDDDLDDSTRRGPAPLHLQATPEPPTTSLPRWLFLFVGLAIGAIGAVVATSVGTTSTPSGSDASSTTSAATDTSSTVPLTVAVVVDSTTTVAPVTGPPSTPAGANDVVLVTTTTTTTTAPPPATAAPTTTVAPTPST